VKIAMHPTASRATASATASYWTTRGAGLLAVRKMTLMPMKQDCHLNGMPAAGGSRKPSS
jgi:hypothetical protein